MKEFKTSNGTIRYRDAGRGLPVVFAHGTPSHSEEFLPCFENLKLCQQDFRFLALDHLGFGTSDKPPTFSYTLQSHVQHFSNWMESLKLSAVHLVVHDFGGPIALPWAIQNSEKIKSLTLLNTWFWPLEKVDPRFQKQKWLLNSALMRFLYLRMNVSPKHLVKMAWGTRRPLTAAMHRQFLAPFPTKKDRHALYACVQALVDGSSFWADHPISGLERLRKVPTQIVWGMKDPLIPSIHLQEWRRRLPQAIVTEVADAGHFVAMEAPEKVADTLKACLGFAP